MESWPDRWVGIENGSALERELRQELSEGHPLFSLRVSAIARRKDQDDVLFAILDGSGRFVVVHLTFSGTRELPPWPGAEFYASKEEFLKMQGRN